jgi:hypothetical protein
VVDDQKEQWRIYSLVQQVHDLERRLADDENEARDTHIAQRALENRIADLEKQAASWTGGFWTLAAAGTIITFVVAFWDKITFGLRHP